MDLFKHYSVINILQIIILLALAVKGLISFLEWAFPRVRQVVKKVEQPRKLKYGIKENSEQIKQIKNDIKQLSQKIDMLIQSDKDDIKAYITRQHHYFVYQKGWIDDYTLDCIERRYTHYSKQGGNSFIKGLIQELRKLPKKPVDADLKK